MMSEKRTGRLIRETVLAMVVIMVFYFCQGAAVVTQGLEGAQAKWTQSVFIWSSVLVALIFFLIKNKNLVCLGFVRPDYSELKGLLYLIPMILIALSGCINGVDFGQSGYIIASLVLTIGVGFSEEIYFRGIILGIWLKNRGKTQAIVISSILFGVTHLLNVLGGASIVATILQIFFAFFYGIVMAFVMIRMKSIWSCMFLHFLHDFCSFIGRDVPPVAEIILGASQAVVLLAFVVYLIRTDSKSIDSEKRH